ncbi:uncharacterized protein LOC120697910 [Panicum virgatum]|uniref:Uncharacterized protein n=1 Tax=Panicum virgatum TaxID=38727 RepID=A0A8T0UN83_PANVG|nr:uncharacterized protein LOC120697910 [Panicum virgatum]KAG2625922.1 hypothetical protein PVAP13_3KG289500 [Panicum virgatum]
MGNYMSCALAKAPGGRGARVILPDGGVRQVALPATAAELMMDAPGHFLVDARAASAGARLAALPADEELELGGAYAAFPMKRLGTPLAAADAARLAATSTREARRSSAKVSDDAPPAGVAAVPAAEEKAPRLRLEDMEVDGAAAAELGALKHRLSNERARTRRRPTLETIEEEHYLSSRA